MKVTNLRDQTIIYYTQIINNVTNVVYQSNIKMKISYMKDCGMSQAQSADLSDKGYLKVLAYVKEIVRPAARGRPSLTRQSLSAMRLNILGLTCRADANIPQFR